MSTYIKSKSKRFKLQDKELDGLKIIDDPIYILYHPASHSPPLVYISSFALLSHSHANDNGFCYGWFMKHNTLKFHSQKKAI